MAKLTTVLLFTLALSVADSLTTLSATPDTDTTEPTLSGHELTSSDKVNVPVNFVNFHPINRHFPRRPLTTSPFNHHHHHRYELFRGGLQIPYDNDMIFSSEEKAIGAESSSEGFIREIPEIKILIGPFALEKIDNAGDEEDGSMKIRVKLIKHKEEGKGERENLFKRKIRKFLNHLI